MAKVTIVIPTYNERDNIRNLLPKIFEIFSRNNIDGNLIVVDDNSPNGTSEEVKKLGVSYPVILITRSRKLGIGSAYIRGFKKALELDSDVVFEMDADFSHDPEEIPEFIENLKDNDVILGSRYIKGGKIENWDLYRKIVSKYANLLARNLLGLKVNDVTTGYRAYKKDVLLDINLERIRSNDYAFQSEILFEVHKKGFKIKEIPITFSDRRMGKSKISGYEVIKFFVLCLELFLKRLKGILFP